MPFLSEAMATDSPRNGCAHAADAPSRSAIPAIRDMRHIDRPPLLRLARSGENSIRSMMIAKTIAVARASGFQRHLRELRVLQPPPSDGAKEFSSARTDAALPS